MFLPAAAGSASWAGFAGTRLAMAVPARSLPLSRVFQAKYSIVGFAVRSLQAPTPRIEMTDKFCTHRQINQIATDLNGGDRNKAMQEINHCVISMGRASDYGKVLGMNFGKIMANEPEASRAADQSFSRLADQERSLWQSIREAANHLSAHGLCQLTIVENKDAGPHAELNGSHCH
jgi:hypothetical protein